MDPYVHLLAKSGLNYNEIGNNKIYFKKLIIYQASALGFLFNGENQIAATLDQSQLVIHNKLTLCLYNKRLISLTKRIHYPNHFISTGAAFINIQIIF